MGGGRHRGGVPKQPGRPTPGRRSHGVPMDVVSVSHRPLHCATHRLCHHCHSGVSHLLQHGAHGPVGHMGHLLPRTDDGSHLPLASRLERRARLSVATALGGIVPGIVVAQQRARVVLHLVAAVLAIHRNASLDNHTRQMALLGNHARRGRGGGRMVVRLSADNAWRRGDGGDGQRNWGVDQPQRSPLVVLLAFLLGDGRLGASRLGLVGAHLLEAPHHH